MPGPYSVARYTTHDATIHTLVAEFNQNKATFIGATAAQATTIPNLTDNLVKAWLIQESGGSNAGSLSAWLVDPAQVNVPGDWSPYKAGIGLLPPTTRNTGTAAGNLRAAIIWLARKGFGTSGKPPQDPPQGTFDGWARALQRYNGRTATTTNAQPYSENYSDRILQRAANMNVWTPIELPQPVPLPAPAATPTPSPTPAPTPSASPSPGTPLT